MEQKLLFITLISSVISSSTDFNYLTFENFESVKNIFESEIKALNLSRNLNSIRTERITILKSCLSDIANCQLKVIDISDKEKKTLRNLRVSFGEFPETKKDFDASIRALVFLIDTYKLDAYHLYKSGQIRQIKDVRVYQNSNLKMFSSFHKLGVKDLILIAKQALEDHLFDVTIHLLKAIFKALNDTNDEDESLRKELESIRKRAVKANNRLLKEKTHLVGESYQLLPYLVNEKSLNKIKNQESIRKKLSITDYASQEAINYFFKQSCRGESFSSVHPLERPNMPKCHYLHHFDPYLKLGPFTIEIASKKPFIMIFHSILNEDEMNWLVNYSKPRLSRDRKTEFGDDEGIILNYNFRIII